MSASTQIDVDRLRCYLGTVFGEPPDAVALEPIAGGQSNPTYFLDAGGRRLVLRKQPHGDLLPSAHAIDREYRVLGALKQTGVPVPEVLHYCEDRSVVGTPFYLMRRVDGRVFHDCALPGVPPAQRVDHYRALAETMARLHAVDPAAIGLGDFGRPHGYFARQIARWTKQWSLTRQVPNPDIDRLVEWLPRSIPDDNGGAISHGDFRVGNVMFAPDGPRVAALLDWELSTLGHPMADLAHCCIAWESGPDEYGGVRGLDLKAEGLPDRLQFVRWYEEASHSGQRLQPFHMAFALFRFAVVFEGIAARAKAGNAASSDAHRYARLTRVFAERAMAHVG